MDEQLLQPGLRIRPQVNIDQAKTLVEEKFQIKVIRVTELMAYDDRNFLIETEQNFLNEGKLFVLKITNSLDSSNPGLLEAINEISCYVHQHAKDLPVPYPISDKDGLLVTKEKLGPDEEKNGVRLMKFIPGTILNKIEYDEDILFQVGQVLGKLTNHLKNYRNPILESRKTIWSLLNVPKLDQFLFAVEEPSKREMVDGIIKEFTQNVIDAKVPWRANIIHGDCNEQNIVVNQVDGRWKISGLLDFGDVHYAPIVFDLAILCCYVTLDCVKIDPLKAPSFVIAGYRSVMDLTDSEWNILPICVMARLAQSLVLGAYSYLYDPGNEYLLSSAKVGWSILERLRGTDVKELLNVWNGKSN